MNNVVTVDCIISHGAITDRFILMLLVIAM